MDSGWIKFSYDRVINHCLQMMIEMPLINALVLHQLVFAEGCQIHIWLYTEYNLLACNACLPSFNSLNAAEYTHFLFRDRTLCIMILHACIVTLCYNEIFVSSSDTICLSSRETHMRSWIFHQWRLLYVHRCFFLYIVFWNLHVLIAYHYFCLKCYKIMAGI